MVTHCNCSHFLDICSTDLETGDGLRTGQAKDRRESDQKVEIWHALGAYESSVSSDQSVNEVGGNSPRAIERLQVPRVGSVVGGRTPDDPPWLIIGADGQTVPAVRLWLLDLHTSDYSPKTIRAYAYDLLSWLRFLSAVDVSWQRAMRAEVRDWVRWHQVHLNPQRTRNVLNHDSRPPAGSVNAETGKAYLPSAYSKATINRVLSSLTGFYEFAIDEHLGPLTNPVPKSRARLKREDAHHSPMEPNRRRRRSPYRQKVPRKTPRALSDDLYEEVFGRLNNDRDRAIIATVVSSGLRADELLSMRRRDLHAANQTVEVVPKGGIGERVVVPVSPSAFVWIARYLASRPPGPPDEPVWMTIRGDRRPLTYWALRQVTERANRFIGSNITMHDFRHTFCTRLAADENLTIVELQELMRHVALSTTMIYLRPTEDELVNKLQAHWDRPAPPPPTPASGYDTDDLEVLFGRASSASDPQ